MFESEQKIRQKQKKFYRGTGIFCRSSIYPVSSLPESFPGDSAAVLTGGSDKGRKGRLDCILQFSYVYRLQVMNFHFFKTFPQLRQRSFFDAGNIASGNIQLFSYFTLCNLFSSAQPVTQTDNLFSLSVNRELIRPDSFPRLLSSSIWSTISGCS